MRQLILSMVRNHSNWLQLSLALILLSVLSSCDRLKNLAGQPESAYVQQIEALSARLNALESVIQQQIPVLRQIRENVTPAEISPQWENQLEQLESQLASSDKWPKDAGEAGQFFEQTSELVTGLPVWAEAKYLQRISLVRWAAMSFNSLNHPRDDSQSLDQLEQLVDEMRDLADASPEGGSEDMVRQLRENAEEIADKTTRRRVKEAVEQAIRYVGDISADTTDIASLYEFLELYEKDNDHADVIDVDISALRKRLYEKIVIRQADDRAASLRAQWKNVKEMSKDQPQPAVYEVATRTLFQQVMSAQAALLLEGIETPVYNELQKELRAAVETIESQAEERQALAMRDYQRWALKGIKAFETAFEAIKKKVDEEGSWWSRDNGGWIDYYKEVQDAMIKRLLPINVALLDLPVQERYHQAFQTGWKKLDGRENQTSVAASSATTRKISLRKFMED